MKAIKRQILYPVLKLYSPNKILIAILANKTTKIAYNIITKKTMNDITTLTFNAPFDNSVISTDDAEMLVKLETDFYIIKTVKLSDQDKSTLEITCESEFTECKGIRCQPLDLIGQSPEQLFTSIIASPKNVNLVGQYKWLGTDIVDTYRAVQTEDSVSVFENWLTMCKKFDAWMEFSTDEYGQKWIYLRKNAINNGKFLRKGQGLKSLDITFDTTGIFTRMYGYGATDNDTSQPINFISVNPTGHAYVEDISYYIAKGMTQEEIYASPRCVQETDYTENTITDVDDLFRIIKEELAKVCIPTVQGNIGISDFSVVEDTAITEPIIGEMVTVVDQDISYAIPVQIQSIERKHTENPYDVSVEISNVIKYDSVLKDLQHTSDTVTSVTSVTSSGKTVVNTSSLQGNINAQNTSLIGTVDLTTPSTSQSTLAILFEDKRIGYPTYGAMGFGTKGLCIANTLKIDGTWDWKIFGTSQGFDADLIKTGFLKDSNGKFSLNLLDGTTSVITQSVGTNTTQIANTAFVINEIANLVDASPTTLNTLNELAQALGDDPNFATTIMNMLSLKTNDIDNTRTTTDKTVTGAINELNARQNIIVDTITTVITVGTGSINLTINGLGNNSIVVTNGDYSLNTAQVLGVKNVSTDNVEVYYSNAIDGNCKFNFTYSK